MLPTATAHASFTVTVDSALFKSHCSPILSKHIVLVCQSPQEMVGRPRIMLRDCAVVLPATKSADCCEGLTLILVGISPLSTCPQINNNNAFSMCT